MPPADPADLGLFCPASLGGAGAFGLQVATTQDGRRAVLAYTSLDALLAGCGERATWVQLTALGLRRLVAERDEVDTVWLDPPRAVAGVPGTGRPPGSAGPEPEDGPDGERQVPAPVVGRQHQVRQDGPAPGGLA